VLGVDHAAGTIQGERNVPLVSRPRR
jgi:hypothetical protein